MSAAKRATQQAEDVRRETELKSLEKQEQMMRTATLDGRLGPLCPGKL